MLGFGRAAKRFLKKFGVRLGKLDDHREYMRTKLARRYIRGSGLEIGALHCPLAVPRSAKVKYVDKRTREEHILGSPEENPAHIVNTDFLEDGFTLASVPDNSQDFVIANHVLEHTPNPLGALFNWSRVLRPNGTLFIAVPIAEKCFDKGRPITAMDHFWEDFELCRKGKGDEFHRRNRAHYEDFARFSVPAKRRLANDYREWEPGEMESETEKMWREKGEIHFHTFSVDSYRGFLELFSAKVDAAMRPVKIVMSTIEAVGILRKSG